MWICASWLAFRASGRYGWASTCARGMAARSQSRFGFEPIRSAGLDLVLVVLDISERKRVEERQRLIIGELNHRVQNLFAVV